MRNTGRKRRQGFTLAEMLLTIGIMVILAGISFVGLTHYQRKLKLLEMDGTAEELFMAAQNEMSTLEANGTLELLSGDALGLPISSSTDETDDEAAGNSTDRSDTGHQCYALVHNAGETGGNVGELLLSYLLPFGVIDDTVRTDGNYRIEYDYTAKTVTAVYYSHAASFLSGSGDAYAFKADGSDADALKKAAGDSNLRQHFDGAGAEAKVGAIVGYYGGGSKTVPDGNLTAPVLTLENGARLLLHIRMPAANKNVNTVLHIRGKNSGAELTADLKDLSNVVSATLTKTSFSAGAQGQSGSILYMAKLSSNAGEDNEYLLCLDSVTEQDTHFAKLFPSLTPGEDIEVYVQCSSTDGYALEVKSNTVSANSLFASVETVSNAWTFDSSGMGSLRESGAEPVPTAMIANVRHLENLDPAVSGLSADTKTENCIQAAVQTQDLVYAETASVTDYEGHAVQTSDTVNMADAFTAEIAEYNTADISVYDLSGNASSGYRPIQNAALLSYDGKGNAVVNFTSETAVSLTNGSAKGQGIFAGISGQKDAKPVSIRDLRMLNCRFTNSESAAAGALIGVVGDSHQLVLQGIETENCQLSSNANVGGLIGTVEAGGTDSAAVKLYVNECGILGEYGSVNGSNAGGFIGSLTGSAETKISSSTASVYVTGSSNAGGFIGEISGQTEIRFSYVGGHTKDGKYPEDSAEGTDAGAAEITGQGRWNVMSAGGNAGGFIGAADSVNLNLTGCYTTASVQSAGNAGAFLAAVSGGGSESASYCYAAGKVSGSNQLSDDVKNLAAEGKEYTGSAYAKPYDEALKTNGNPQYPYMTTAELYTAALADTAVPEVTGGSRSLKYGSKHIGDFSPAEEETMDTFLRFLNGPRLYVEVFTPLKENETNYLTMVLTGTAEKDAAQENLNYFQFSAELQADRTVKLTRLASPNSSDKHMQYNRAAIVSAAGKEYLVYRILLDDISVSYMHFSDITKDIRAGSNITGYAVAEKKTKEDAWYTEEQYRQASVDAELVNQLLPAANTDLNLRGTAAAAALEQYDWDSESTAVYDTDNSLFGRSSSPLNAENNGHTAYILSCRHLENLDHYVSQLENAEGKRDNAVKLPTDVNAFSYRRAVQQKDLYWDRYIAAVGENGTEFCIYKPSSDTAITGSGFFYGIQNLLLEEYDGGYHSISNLRMQGDKNDDNTAGLFAAVPANQQSNLTIYNLELRNIMSCLNGNGSSKKNSAAALVGYYGSSKGLTIRNVVISGAEVQSDMDAGGLLGLADGSGTIAIQNCVVYEGEKTQNGTRPYKLLISSVGGESGRKNTTDGSASAGGLIGRSRGSAQIYVSGCSVFGEKALILAKGIGTSDSNTDDSAGGLVGTVAAGSLNIDNCGVAAYVYDPNGDCTGGLVGDFNADGSIKNSYVAALTNATTSFTDACAIDLSKLYTDTSYDITHGGYTIYGHLATGGLVGYIKRTVSIQNCFMSASVSANVDQSYSYNSGSRNEAYKTQKYFFGGLLGQLGAGTDSAKTVNCYAAGRIFDPSSGKRNLFMGSVLGYSMSNVNDYFYDANTQLTAYCLNGVSFTEDSSRFIGGQGSELLTRSQEKQYQNNANNNYGQGYYQTKIYGLQSVGLDQLKPTGSAASTIPLNTYLSGSYPLLTWTRLYTPAEILGGSSDVSVAPLRYIGDWCLN